MAKVLNTELDAELKEKCLLFEKGLDSKMNYKSEYESSSLSLDWLLELEKDVPYIDNIIRNPKFTLVRVENVVKVEKIRKVTVDSVKNLARNTQFIEKIKENNEIQPAKILEVRNEETFNTYENRFIYTLIDSLRRFIRAQEAILEDYETKSGKILRYEGSTLINNEKINIALKVSSSEVSDIDDESFEDEIGSIRDRLAKIKKYLSSWDKSEFLKSLKKEHVPFVYPPIKKTNLILKNPNFQVATKLWEYLRKYEEDSSNAVNGLDTNGDELLLGILNHSFLLNYFVLDSIDSSKRMQKNNLSNYAIIMVNEQIKKIVSLLFNCGITISDEEILNMISKAVKEEREKKDVDAVEIKKQFQEAMDEYLERIQDYL